MGIGKKFFVIVCWLIWKRRNERVFDNKETTIDGIPLKASLIQFLPKFSSFADDDPFKHLKEFHLVCSTMKPKGAPVENVKLKAFPFCNTRNSYTFYTCLRCNKCCGVTMFSKL